MRFASFSAASITFLLLVYLMSLIGLSGRRLIVNASALSIVCVLLLMAIKVYSDKITDARVGVVSLFFMTLIFSFALWVKFLVSG